jgi:hypothetical protein
MSLPGSGVTYEQTWGSIGKWIWWTPLTILDYNLLSVALSLLHAACLQFATYSLGRLDLLPSLALWHCLPTADILHPGFPNYPRAIGTATLTHSNKIFTKLLHEPRIWTDSLNKRHKRRNMDTRLRTWNVRILYRASTIVTGSKELSKYKWDLVGLHEVRWEGGGTEPAGEYTFLYGKGNENHEFGTGFLCIRKSYQQLRGLNLLVTKRSLVSYHYSERSCFNRG